MTLIKNRPVGYSGGGGGGGGGGAAWGSITGSLSAQADLVAALATKQKYANDAFIVVATSSDPLANGTALLDAYAAAKALTPNGAALSATNRAVVLIPPGVYSLGTTQLALDTQFVDLVGISTNKSDARITSAVVASNGGTIRQTVSDVALENLTIDNTASTRSANDATDASAYAPNGSLSATRITNCEFKDGGGASWCMRQSVTYSGMYQFCVCADYSFGGHGGAFGGTGQNCTVGAHSFADNATMMGTVTDCVASSASFGGGNSGLLTGLAFRCTAGSGSFGSGGLSGFVQNCKASDNSFAGAAGIFSGTAIDCEGAAHCFAAFGGTFSGRAFDCTALNDSFGGDAATVSGIIESCIAGNGSFGHAGTFSGSLTDCRLLNANDVTYPQTWTRWTHAWAPIAFTGRVTGMRFDPTGSDLDAVILPDGTSSGSFEYCSFVPTGTGLAVAIATDGDAELRLAFCDYNGAEIADGLTNDFSFEGAAIGQVQRRDGAFESLLAAGGTTLRTTSARLLRINSTGAAVNEYLQDLFNIRATLDFGSISALASADLTIAVTGAVVGDTVALGLPAAPTAGIIFQCFVSATNTVTVRATNITALSVDPASAEYQVTVFKFQDAS